MDTDLNALKSLIKLLADAALDTSAVVAAGAPPVVAIFTYKNLIPDILSLIPKIGEIPAEAKNLAPSDYVILVTELTKDLSITDIHAGAIIDAVLALTTSF